MTLEAPRQHAINKLDKHILLDALFNVANGKQLDPDNIQTIETIIKESEYPISDDQKYSLWSSEEKAEKEGD